MSTIQILIYTHLPYLIICFFVIYELSKFNKKIKEINRKIGGEIK